MSVASEQNCDVHLHAEIEVLKQALVEKQNQLIAMETACLRESDRQAELEDSIIAWQDKYDRLYESHKRVQKVNQSLEDKLLKLVDRNSGERAQLTSDVATLSVRLAQANYNIAKLQREIERYKTDINLAIQLLQCKPDSFLPQKISSLPMDIQSKVSSYMRLETNSHSDSEGSTNGVGVSTSGSYKVLPASDSPPPVCPFPPTAMVYSMRGLDAQISDSLNGSEQMISPSIMVKYLEDELKASEIKHCDTCKCSTKDLTVLADEPRSYSIGTQTVLQGEGNSLCLRCNSNLNSPSRTNSPYIMKLVKSSDSVISETKSTVSDMNDTDKLFTQPKKDDLMVNPILGHHRLCDRTSGKQNQQLCDTAKYFVENRKLDCDLIDFRKHNKSPKMAINNDNYSTCNRSLTSDTMLNDASRKNDCSTLLLNAEAEKNDSNLIQGKGDISVEDRKNDSKGHLESGSSGYSSAEKRNLQTTITGSTNSLWSKTSSSEGAKIFESFNRNLIKTIKAENPKYRGPRLCALRIQNGSNNILLDNIESEITPIVYTRRQRFLDEELDDTKDIITSKISMVMSNQASIPNPNCPTMEDGKNSVSLGQISAGEGNVYDINREDIEPICDATHSHESDSKVALILDNINLDNSNVSPTNALSNQKLIQIDGNSGRNLTNSNSQINSSNNFLELHCDRLKELGIINDSKLEQQKCFDDLDSCENFDDTKSCTQSSSISSNDADIDIQENAILRQQQLTRVAEWVQNNSHIEIVANRQKTSNYNNNVSCSNFSNNCSVNRNTENIPSSLSFNDSSIEKLSIDSGYKTTKLIQNGACNNTSNTTYINSTSTNPVHCQAKFNADNNFCTNDCIAQNSLVNSKYYFNEFAQNTPMHKMQKHKQLNSGNECNLAQMEYNVKQFLLKQNEWCTKNKSTNSSLITNGQNSILVNKCNSNNYESAAVKSHPRRTETNL